MINLSDYKEYLQLSVIESLSDNKLRRKCGDWRGRTGVVKRVH